MCVLPSSEREWGGSLFCQQKGLIQDRKDVIQKENLYQASGTP